MSLNVPGPVHTPWNKGLLIGQKKPLRPKHVWSIRVRLELGKSARNLALFNLAIDSKLRACDLVRLRVNDVCQSGVVRERASVVQQKTGRPVRFEITEHTRSSIERLLSSRPDAIGGYLFPGRSRHRPHISTRQLELPPNSRTGSGLRLLGSELSW